MNKNETAGGLGVGPRQSEQIRSLEDLNRRLRKVEQGTQDDEDLKGKDVRFELDSGDTFAGTVISVSKFRIKIRMPNYDKEIVLYKSHIRWHEVI
jgi:hypothetical protein